MAEKGRRLLESGFLVGTIADAIVAINWFLIAAGAEIPNSLSGMVGSGAEYRFAMYISGVFMAGWAIILWWGWFKPFERKGLLLITAGMILLSILAEVVFYRSILAGPGFVVGVATRTALVGLFSWGYFGSGRGEAKS